MQLAEDEGSKRMKVAEPEQVASTEAQPEAQALAAPVAVVEEKPAETQSPPEEAKPAVEEAPVIESPPSVVKDVAAAVETVEAQAEAPTPKKDEEKVISSTNELEKAYINEMAKESVKASETEDAEKIEAQKWRNLNLKKRSKIIEF